MLFALGVSVGVQAVHFPQELAATGVVVGHDAVDATVRKSVRVQFLIGGFFVGRAMFDSLFCLEEYFVGEIVQFVLCQREKTVDLPVFEENLVIDILLPLAETDSFFYIGESFVRVGRFVFVGQGNEQAYGIRGGQCKRVQAKR